MMAQRDDIQTSRAPGMPTLHDRAAKLRNLADDLDFYADAQNAEDLTKAVGLELIHVGAELSGVRKATIEVREPQAVRVEQHA